MGRSGTVEENFETARGGTNKYEDVPERFTFAPKSTRTTSKVFEKFGFSDNYPKCLATVEGRIRRGVHSNDCRKRFDKKAMSQIVEMKRTVDAANERRPRFLESGMDRAEQTKRKNPSVRVEDVSSGIGESLSRDIGGSVSSGKNAIRVEGGMTVEDLRRRRVWRQR